MVPHPGWRRKPGRPRCTWLRDVLKATLTAREAWTAADDRQELRAQQSTADYAFWWWWWWQLSNSRKIQKLVSQTYGSFMRMKRRHMKKDTMMQTNATASSRIRFSRGIIGLLVWSNMTKPSPPIVKRKLDAKPSIMYWPLTRYCMKATWNTGKYTHGTHTALVYKETKSSRQLTTGQKLKYINLSHSYSIAWDILWNHLASHCPSVCSNSHVSNFDEFCPVILGLSLFGVNIWWPLLLFCQCDAFSIQRFTLMDTACRSCIKIRFQSWWSITIIQHISILYSKLYLSVLWKNEMEYRCFCINFQYNKQDLLLWRHIAMAVTMHAA